MKTMRKFLSLLVGISMIIAMSATTFAANPIWRISGTTETSTAVFSIVEAYEGKNSLHITRAADDTATITVYPAIADNQYKLVNMAGNDIWQMDFSFYAKGTLPESASVKSTFTNGSRTLMNADVSKWTVGEADENGWYKVSMMSQNPNWQGAAGGNIGMPVITVSGACDFYMDNIEMTFKTWDSGWTAKIAKFDVLEGLDVGFEDETATELEIVEPEPEAPAADPIWKISGTTETSTAVFSIVEAYEGKNSLHITRAADDTATITVYPAIADNQYKLVNMAGNDIWQMDFSFYAKGTLPESASVKSTFTNGSRTLMNADVSKWTVGEADENGWYKVSMMSQESNWQGAAGGNIGMPVITISGACDFYMDDIVMNFKTYDSNWSTKIATFDVLAELDGGFENETATELEIVEPEEPEPEEPEEPTIPVADPIWRVSGATEDATIVFSEAFVYGGKNAAHIKYEEGASATLKLTAAIADDQYKLVNMAGGDIWQMDLSFWAKGILPSVANVTSGFTNGSRTLMNADVGSWKIDEADENGWYKVSMQGQVSNWQGPAGGNISMPVFTISSECDFFMDNIVMNFKTYDSSWATKIETFNVFDKLDYGFENETATEFEAEEPGFEEVVAPIWKISGQAANATAVVSTANAYEGNNSVHIVYNDPDKLASISLSMGLQDKDYTMVNWKNGAIYDTILTFYAKGILPESANVKASLANGFRTLLNADVSSWKIGEADENGWYKVTAQGQYPEWQGASGGNIASPVITINGKCDFYIDNVVLTFKVYNADWTDAIPSFNVFEKLDGGFENEIATEFEANDSDAVTGLKFDIVDFGDNEFSSIGENAEVLYEDIDWLEPGYYMASVTLVNNTGDEALFVTALYKNGVLADCVVLKPAAETGKQITYKSVIEIPEMDGTDEYELKTFVWDNAMSPISAPLGIR